MRGLAADISDQTCKTAAQSRTRFVGHRQLPWIHTHYSGIRIRVVVFVDRRGGKAKRAHRDMPCDLMVGTARRAPLPTLRLFPSMGAQLALALDHVGRKLEIGFAA